MIGAWGPHLRDCITVTGKHSDRLSFESCQNFCLKATNTISLIDDPLIFSASLGRQFLWNTCYHGIILIKCGFLTECMEVAFVWAPGEKYDVGDFKIFFQKIVNGRHSLLCNCMHEFESFLQISSFESSEEKCQIQAPVDNSGLTLILLEITFSS